MEHSHGGTVLGVNLEGSGSRGSGAGTADKDKDDATVVAASSRGGGRLAKLRESLARRMSSATQEKSWGFSDEPAPTTAEPEPGTTDKAEKGEVCNPSPSPCSADHRVGFRRDYDAAGGLGVTQAVCGVPVGTLQLLGLCGRSACGAVETHAGMTKRGTDRALGADAHRRISRWQRGNPCWPSSPRRWRAT